jgi:O-antigen/teichoic acid export membrane protein
MMAGDMLPGPGRVARGLAWTVGSAGAQGALQIGTLAVLGRLLTPQDFGIVAAALVIASFSTIFAQLGVNQAVIQRRDLEDGVSATAFIVSMTLALLLTATLVAAAPLVEAQLQLPGLSPVLKALAATFVLRALGATGEALLLRDRRFRAVAIIELSSYALGYAIVGVALAAAGAGLWALVAAQLVQGATRSGLTLALRRHGLRPDLSRAGLTGLLRFGGGHSLGRIANFVALQADNLVVARGLGAAALGIYSRAYQMMGLPAALLGSAIDRVLFPTMARQQGDIAALRASYLRGLSLIALLTLPTGFVLSAAAGEIVRLLLGSGWEGVVAPFQIFALTMAFRVSDRLSAVVTRALGVVYRRALVQSLYAVAVIGAAIAGLPYGVYGVALGVACALAMNHVVSTLLALHVLGGRARDAAAAQASALPLALLAGSSAFAAAALLRALAAPDAVTLAGILLVTLAASLGGVMASPRALLGRHGDWLLMTLASLLPLRIGRPLRRLSRRAGGG